MKTSHAKKIIMLLIFAMFLMTFSSIASAEEAPGVKLLVTISYSSSPPATDKEYIIVLEADNPDYPMPKGSEYGIYSFPIVGGSTIKLPEIKFTSLGVYTYTVYQSLDIDESAGYDDAKYNLVIYVTNAEDGSGLETTVILYTLGETQKLDEIVFSPHPPVEPEIPEEPEPPKTSDDTTVLPYLVLFSSGVALLLILGMTKKNKIED